MIGTRLGPYEITAKLGEGGMGEVYRATDTRLGREVAIKVLPESVAQDPERLARFEREAKILASLNHSNIATIHGIEEGGSAPALVMELVEGPTLADRIAQGPIPVDEALPIAKQIAEGLEYAHERGIIHRDLKPVNIKLTPEGQVKILDFGLAKALEPDAAGGASVDLSHSPTLTYQATAQGLILGTAAYMSPEQARGQAVDKRSDIWSFGVVLWEMLTGRKLFEGDTVSDTLAAILTREPDLSELPASTPPALRRLLSRCLERNPKGRLRDIGDARITIDETLARPETEGVGLQPLDEQGSKTGVFRLAVWATAAALVVLALVLGWWLGRRRLNSPPAWYGELLPGPTIAFYPRASPDGRLVAFQAMVDNQTQVAVMDPVSGNWTVLTHVRERGDVADLSWSHDGSKIYFDRYYSVPGGVYSVSRLGGEERLVLADASSPEALPDGSLLVTRVDPDRRTQIYHFWPASGRLEPMGAWAENSPSTPLRVVPGGKSAVFFGRVKGESSDAAPHLYRLDIASKATKRLAPELPIAQTSQAFPLAVTPDGRSVLIDLPAGNLHRIVAIPLSGVDSPKTLLTLTSGVWSLDAEPGGGLYVDQVERALDVLKASPSGGAVRELASVESYPLVGTDDPRVELGDGRLVLSTLIAGKGRLLLGKPGGNFVPLLDTDEEVTPPVGRVGTDELAVITGSPPGQVLTLVSVGEGRIIRRFEETKGQVISEVGASPDAKTIYYTTSGSVWSVPTPGGTPRKVCVGDGFAFAPDGKYLVVNLDERTGVHLKRVPLDGGSEEPLEIKSEIPIAPGPLAAEAINRQGDLLVGLAPRNSWFWSIGRIDLATGALQRVPLTYAGDLVSPKWASDGQIVMTGIQMRSHIWRFRPLRGLKD